MNYSTINNKKKGFLIFNDGTTFEGFVFSNGKPYKAEVVFNTSMSGYQEVLSDPSYNGQIVVFSTPIIGSYGMNSIDYQSDNITVSGLVINQYSDYYSNAQSNASLKEVLEKQSILGIQGVDTRRLVKYIRDKGCVSAVITDDIHAPYESTTTTFQPEYFNRKSLKRIDRNKKTLAIIDFGVKKSIVDQLKHKGFNCLLLPMNSSLKDLQALSIDGVVLSNGPGDPRDYIEYIPQLKKIILNYTTLGICLGHQLIALAFDATIEKLPFGHHGVNHPILELQTQKILISSQNHNYTVKKESLDPVNLKVTHINLIDDSIAGFKHKTLAIHSVQFHPEASPGPLDGSQIFDSFIDVIEQVTSLVLVKSATGP
jgi:carbamoyl-phosphate synthase small subunit